MDTLINLLMLLTSSSDPTDSLVHILLLVIISGLAGVLAWIVRDRKRLLKIILDRDKKISIIIDRYHEDKVASNEAMYSIKEVLIELRTLVGISKK